MKEKNKETVCAVVVTYNRKNLLLECLEALRKQTRPIQGIYLIDNASTDGTPELLLKKGYIKELPPKDLVEPWEKEFEIENLTGVQLIKLYYVRMHKNTGGAGGFYEGVKRAYEKGYDWLWLMDDDAEPSLNALENMLKFENKDKASFLAPQVRHKTLYNHTEYYHHKTKLDLVKIKEYNLKNQILTEPHYKLEANGFVGPMLNRQAIKVSGKLPDKSYFIWWDDTDYTYELFKSFGYGYLITDSIMYHKDIVVNEIEYDWKTYYGVRNRIRFFKKHTNLVGKIVLTIKTIRLYFQLAKKLDRKKFFEFSIKELFCF
jgi:rhamnopyranosyl-N-acetylglucosaminyl-diphospho-decaprenol beta-1,3/1,4-galactofuranosyltransferase